MAASSFYRRPDYRNNLQPASEAFLAWLVANRAPESIVSVFQEGTLREDVEDYPLLLLSEGAMMDVDYIPIGVAIENGFLVFGVSVGCGDPAVIDLRGDVGAVGYLNHETLQSVQDVRGRAFWPVTFSLDEGAELVSWCNFPIDYHDARREDLAKEG